MLVVGGDLYSPFSVIGDSLNTAEWYNSSSNTWTLTDDLHYARSDHAASLLNNGKVLITGGFADFCQSTAELYDP